jgi:hypothetical protein
MSSSRPALRRLAAASIALLCAAAARADVPSSCGLLRAPELAELGVPASVRPTETRDLPNLAACTYRAETGGSEPSITVVTVTVSTPGRDRIAEFDAMVRKATGESSGEQLRARGEFYGERAMCRVELRQPAELSRCVGVTDASVVAFALSRSVAGQDVAYPKLQLALVAQLLERVRARGG